MIKSTRFTTLAAAACASALLVAGAGTASAQGSLMGDEGSSVVPVFNSPSEGALTALGDGAYEVSYTNRSGKDLACIGVVLPAKVASDLYAEMQKHDFATAPGGDEEDGSSVDPEVQAAYEKALEDGHFGLAVGEDGIGYFDYLRLTFELQYPDLTDEELVEFSDEYEGMLEQVFPGIRDSLLGQNIVNFVDDGENATWAAAMTKELGAGEKAGGIIGCFDGVTRALDVEETTYVEMEHATEGTVSGGGTGTLSSNIFGS